jgi:hypothetical protein
MKAWLLLLMLPFSVLADEPKDPIRVQCEQGLHDSLQEMLESVAGAEKVLGKYEIEGSLLESVLATYRANVELCVAGVEYFKGLAQE